MYENNCTIHQFIVLNIVNSSNNWIQKATLVFFSQKNSLNETPDSIDKHRE